MLNTLWKHAANKMKYKQGKMITSQYTLPLLFIGFSRFDLHLLSIEGIFSADNI
jgi:hypothetical protein